MNTNGNSNKIDDLTDEDVFVELDSRWSDVRSFNDLLKVNKSFIEGMMPFSPYRGAPLPVSSPEIKQKLIDLHKYGLLITDRQDASSRCNFKPSYENMLYDVEQRGYLRFYINCTNDTQQFILPFLKKMSEEEINFYVINLSTGKYQTNLSKETENINVKKTRHVVTENNLSSLDWRRALDTDFDSEVENYLQNFDPKMNENNLSSTATVTTSTTRVTASTDWRCALDIDFDPEVESYLWKFNSKIDELLKNSIHFILVTPEYGKGNLENIVMNICSNITVIPPYDLDLINNYVVGTKYFDPRWVYCRNYTDLLKINKEFVEGIIKSTPYQCGPLDNPSPELVKNLIKLHQYGLLTVNGQESVCIGGKMNYRKEWYDVEQRGYLDFHVQYNDIKLAESLLRYIKQTDLVYIVVDMNTGNTITNLSNEIKRYNVTRDRSNKNKETLKITPWRYYTNINYYTRPSDLLWCFDENTEINKILKNTVFFSVAMPEYGKGNLEEIILDMCHKAGAKIYNFDEMIDDGSFADYKKDFTDKIDYDPIDVLTKGFDLDIKI